MTKPKSARKPWSKGGRPPSINDEKVDLIVRYLRVGGYLQVAARAAGVHPETLRLWRKWARIGKEPYAQYAEQFDQAMAEAEMSHLTTIQMASRSQWQAAAWILERVFDGYKVQVDHAHTMQIDKRLLSETQKQAIALLMERSVSEDDVRQLEKQFEEHVVDALPGGDGVEGADPEKGSDPVS